MSEPPRTRSVTERCGGLVDRPSCEVLADKQTLGAISRRDRYRCEPQHRNDAIPQVFPRLRDRACTLATQWYTTEFATHYPLAPPATPTRISHTTTNISDSLRTSSPLSSPELTLPRLLLSYLASTHTTVPASRFFAATPPYLPQLKLRQEPDS